MLHCWVLCLSAACAMWIGKADTLSDATFLAAQREAEERFKRLSADVQTLQETQEALLRRNEELRQRLDRLADEIQSFKEDQSRSSGNLVSRDELRKFVEKLKEVDEKRESDKRIILESIKELAKVPVAVAAVEPKPSARQSNDSSEDVYLYEVKKNDRLFEIMAEYNKHFQKTGYQKLTMDQIIKANPGLRPDLLVTGRKIRIPIPPKADK